MANAAGANREVVAASDGQAAVKKTTAAAAVRTRQCQCAATTAEAEAAAADISATAFQTSAIPIAATTARKKAAAPPPVAQTAAAPVAQTEAAAAAETPEAVAAANTAATIEIITVDVAATGEAATDGDVAAIQRTEATRAGQATTAKTTEAAKKTALAATTKPEGVKSASKTAAAAEAARTSAEAIAAAETAAVAANEADGLTGEAATVRDAAIGENTAAAASAVAAPREVAIPAAGKAATAAATEEAATAVGDAATVVGDAATAVGEAATAPKKAAILVVRNAGTAAGEAAAGAGEVAMLAAGEAATAEEVTKVAEVLSVSVGVEREASYFSSYGDPRVQSLMLRDKARTSTFHRAVALHQRCCFEDAIVMDVGAGTGILSLFAARTGRAKRVYAVEASENAFRLLQQIIIANNLQHIIVPVHATVEQLIAAVEKAAAAARSDREEKEKKHAAVPSAVAEETEEWRCQDAIRCGEWTESVGQAPAKVECDSQTTAAAQVCQTRLKRKPGKDERGGKGSGVVSVETMEDTGTVAVSAAEAAVPATVGAAAAESATSTAAEASAAVTTASQGVEKMVEKTEDGRLSTGTALQMAEKRKTRGTKENAVQEPIDYLQQLRQGQVYCTRHQHCEQDPEEKASSKNYEKEEEEKKKEDENEEKAAGGMLSTAQTEEEQEEVVLMKTQERDSGDSVAAFVEEWLQQICAKDGSSQGIDLIISEWMGFYLLHECMLDSLLLARDFFLSRKGGKLFPSRCRLMLSMAALPQYWREEIDVFRCFHGFDFSPLQQQLLQQHQQKPLLLQLQSHQTQACIPGAVLDWDLMQVSRHHIKSIRNDHVWLNIEQTSCVHAFALWFDCWFTHCQAGVLTESAAPIEETNFEGTSRDLNKVKEEKGFQHRCTTTQDVVGTCEVLPEMKKKVRLLCEDCSSCRCLQEVDHKGLQWPQQTQMQMQQEHFDRGQEEEGDGLIWHERNCVLDTSPQAEPTHWMQTVVLLPQPMEATAGLQLRCCVEMQRQHHTDRAYELSVQVVDATVQQKQQQQLQQRMCESEGDE